MQCATGRPTAPHRQMYHEVNMPIFSVLGFYNVGPHFDIFLMWISTILYDRFHKVKKMRVYMWVYMYVYIYIIYMLDVKKKNKHQKHSSLSLWQTGLFQGQIKSHQEGGHLFPTEGWEEKNIVVETWKPLIWNKGRCMVTRRIFINS